MQPETCELDGHRPVPLQSREAVNRLSILHVLAPCEAGGVESVVRLLAIGHRDRGCTVHVAAIVNGARRDHPFVVSLRDAGIDVIPLALPARAYLNERATVAKLCRLVQPSVVHTHGYRADVVDGGVARRLGIPTVTTVHGFAGGDLKNRFYEQVQRVAYRSFDTVVAVSRPLVERLAAARVPRDRIHCVPNAYTPTTRPLDRPSARRVLGMSDDGFVVGWVGRLSREKGADVLVDALPRLVDPSCQISVFGDGVERRQLVERATARGVGDKIRWHGIVDDAASYFRAFDVLVLSSRTEGTPIVLFEAMATGVPIIATRVGGVPDVLSSAEALLIPPEDPEALAAAVRDIYYDRDGAADRAVAARRRFMTDFQAAPWLERYESLYRESVMHRARSHS